MADKMILAADIGGSFSRFAVMRVGGAGPTFVSTTCVLKTHDHESLSGLIQAACRVGTERSDQQMDAVVLAVPGPVEDGRSAELANVGWSVDIAAVERLYPACPVFIINDFEAQAFGCLTPAAMGAICVQTGRRRDNAVIAVVGAGTGLGHCALVPDGRGDVTAIASEAAHVAFPFLAEEVALGYLDFFQRYSVKEPPTADMVVSGRGLSLLHRYLTGEDILPEEVVRRIHPDSPTTHCFARFYGRVCRHYALSVLPMAGLYITGGVAVRSSFLVDNDTWRKEFNASGSKAKLLADIPVKLITDARMGLWGAARYGATRLL